MHEVSVFKPNYSLYQIIQLVLFYKNISSKDIRSLADVAWEKENSSVLQVEENWTKYIWEVTVFKAHLQLRLKISVSEEHSSLYIFQVQSECDLKAIGQIIISLVPVYHRPISRCQKQPEICPSDKWEWASRKFKYCTWIKLRRWSRVTFSALYKSNTSCTPSLYALYRGTQNELKCWWWLIQ